jgi:hypothetical protein
LRCLLRVPNLVEVDVSCCGLYKGKAKEKEKENEKETPPPTPPLRPPLKRHMSKSEQRVEEKRRAETAKLQVRLSLEDFLLTDALDPEPDKKPKLRPIDDHTAQSVLLYHSFRCAAAHMHALCRPICNNLMTLHRHYL